MMATLPQTAIDPDLAAKVAEWEGVALRNGFVGEGVEETERRGKHGTDRTNKTHGTNAAGAEEVRVGVADLKKQRDWLSRWEAEHDL